ncbi:hypothetical protein BGLA2_1580004 [Burkholderia gladioli]|nr:hypothetical protein BGLA2_1580004 [Burkholderia gladioli]
MRRGGIFLGGRVTYTQMWIRAKLAGHIINAGTLTSVMASVVIICMGAKLARMVNLESSGMRWNLKEG